MSNVTSSTISRRTEWEASKLLYSDRREPIGELGDPRSVRPWYALPKVSEQHRVRLGGANGQGAVRQHCVRRRVLAPDNITRHKGAVIAPCIPSKKSP